MRFPFRFMCGGSSGFPGRLREERAHQRLQLLAAAARTLVLSALPRPDGQGQGHFRLAPLAVELVVRHGGSSSGFDLVGTDVRPSRARALKYTPFPTVLAGSGFSSPRFSAC